MNLNEISPFDLSDETRDQFFGDLNKQIADLVFDEIRRIGYTPYNIYYGDTYFIMRGNPNSVITFDLKTFRSWAFGMWVNSDNLFAADDELPVVEIFFQHRDQIDKFKPSASTFCITIDVYSFKSYLEGGSSFILLELCELESMLKWVRYHSFLAYQDVKPDYYKGIGAFRYWLKYQSEAKFEYYGENLGLTIFVPYAERKIKQFENSNIVESADIFGLGEGWVSSTRITVLVKFRSDATSEQIDDLVHKLLPLKTKKIWKISPYNFVLSFEFFQNSSYIEYNY